MADDTGGAADEELIFDDRRNRRVAVSMDGAILHAGERYVTHITDLSAGGCRVDAAVDFATGMPVNVELGSHGRFPGVVVWNLGPTLGLAFAETPGQVLARLGPTASALGLHGPDADETGVSKIVDPT